MAMDWDYTKKCCANCKYHCHDWSTDADWCNKDDGDWVRQESDDYWSLDYDYCTNFEYDDSDIDGMV